MSQLTFEKLAGISTALKKKGVNTKYVASETKFGRNVIVKSS